MRIAVSLKGGNIHVVIHECRITEPRADDLQTLVKKLIGGVKSGSQGQIGTGDVAFSAAVPLQPLSAVSIITKDKIAAIILEFFPIFSSKMLRMQPGTKLHTNT